MPLIRFTYRVWVLLLAGACMGGESSVHGQTILACRVFTEDGDIPVIAADTYLYLNGIQVHTAKTDTSGVSQVEGLLPGLYELEVQCTGFTTKRITHIQVRPGRTIMVVCPLTPSGVPGIEILAYKPAFIENTPVCVGMTKWDSPVLPGRTVFTRSTLYKCSIGKK
jgi:hypothetical protein